MNKLGACKSTRRHERVRTTLWVSYGVDSIDAAGCAESVSEGGLHINTNDVLGVGTRLVLRIEFPERAVLQEGEVTWAIRVPEHLRNEMVCGMGIQFVDAGPAWFSLFRRWRRGQTHSG